MRKNPSLNGFLGAKYWNFLFIAMQRIVENCIVGPFKTRDFIYFLFVSAILKSVRKWIWTSSDILAEPDSSACIINRIFIIHWL
jgi:hypothetical protein